MTREPTPNDIAQADQRTEWRRRTAKQIVEGNFDIVTSIDLFSAALEQSYSEGVLDSAALCDEIAESISADRKFVVKTIANSLRKYDEKNKQPLRVD